MDELLSLIRRFEGLRLRPYLCPAGVPTIGYGHTGRDVTTQMEQISHEQAEQFLFQDAARHWNAVGRVSPRLLVFPSAHAAIADFSFNLGTGAYRASTLRKKVDAGDWDAVCTQLLKWVWGGGRRLPGLVLRRAAEVRLIKEVVGD